MIEFIVVGEAIPQGSKSLYGDRMVEAHPQIKAWRTKVAWYARKATPPDWDMTGPMAVSISFFHRRPKSHYGRDCLVRPGAPSWKHTRPDGDKLVRAIFDSLTDAKVWKDDSQAALCSFEKAWADKAFTRVVVRRMAEL